MPVSSRDSADSGNGDVYKLNVQARIDVVEEKMRALSRRVEAFSLQQHTHCDHLTEVYQDMEQFLLRNYPMRLREDYLGRPEQLPGSASSAVFCDGDSRGDVASHPDPQLLTPEVAEVLADFREEIVRQGRQTEAQLQQMQAAIAAVREEVKTCRAQCDDLCSQCRLQRSHEESNARASQDEREELVEEVKRRIVDDLANARKEQLQGFDKRMGKAEKAIYAALDARCANAVALAEEGANRLLQVGLAKSAETSLSTNNALLNLGKAVDELTARVSASERHLLAVQQEVAALSVPPPPPPTREREASVTNEMQEQLRRVTAEVEEQRRVLDRVRSDTSLEGAFVEVKDWLLDLEKRAMSRGEMLELANRYETRFAELDRVIHSLSSHFPHPDRKR